jgi:hypothetical protein
MDNYGSYCTYPNKFERRVRLRVKDRLGGEVPLKPERCRPINRYVRISAPAHAPERAKEAVGEWDRARRAS